MKGGVEIKTRIGTSTADTITVCGHDLVDDLVGNIDAGQLLFLEIMGKLPTPQQAALLNAMIVSLAEHGMMPSIIAARMTMLGAPESFQGALASGLLGVGDTFVGPTANVARLLQTEAPTFGDTPDERAANLVKHYFGKGLRIPGLGHPHHPVDPRAEKLLAMQKDLGLKETHAAQMRKIQLAASEARGSHLTFNATAAVGAICSDMGIDWRAVRGIGLVARSIGLVGHIFEEMRQPSAKAMWSLIEDKTQYADPPA